jgi:hypothetical protein
MTNKKNVTGDEIYAFLASGGKITKGRTVTVISAADRRFRKAGYSRDAARIARLNARAA